jgi:homoserine O-acetyltransferase
VADIGDLLLASGQTLNHCRVGYRTFGKLDEGHANAVLFPTWFGGTTANLVDLIGPGKLIDSTRFFVIAVDALANGVSSSPSNSPPPQSRMRFPEVAIRDMVESQRALLTRVLHVTHLRAVMGISMGGMQAFQWAVAYPEFMDRVVPVVGSPQLAPYDLVHWQAQIDAITNDAAWKNGDYTANPGTVADAEFGSILLTTPENFNKVTTRKQVFEMLQKAKTETRVDANNKIRQAQAMMALDVAAPFGGSLERAAAAVKAKMLVVVAQSDHTVTPGPALEFARLANAKVLELVTDCGHMGPSCESAKVNAAVAEFLAQ